MIALDREEDCCGCTACASVCAADCIEMRENSEGFLYPRVDDKRCIGCYKCEEVCPVANRPVGAGKPAAFLVRVKDSEMLRRCTSGGVFTALADQTVSQGGVAYGASFREDFTVHHERITDREDVRRLSGSKYVQSDMRFVFSQVKNDLHEGRQVIFCGTPCQVAGLHNNLDRKYENLFLIDLVCHGVPSPKLWMNYIDHTEKKEGKLQYINFRSKLLGYHVSVMEEQFANGGVQGGSARTNLMLRCYFKDVADRPICYECPFKTVSRCSDLTLFDGWHANKYVKGLKDDDKGYTIVLAQSAEGRNRIEKSGDLLCFYPIDRDLAISLDGKMATYSIERPHDRDEFYQMLDEYGIEETVKTLFPIKKKDNLIEETKVKLRKLGILPLLKGAKEQLEKINVKKDNRQ